ncbi:MAG: hypothetical protein JWM53_2075 [bacterium]|nr:hypothetical protein [bacterium]
MRRALVVGLAALAVGGCGDQFDPASFVDTLRLLAVKAEPPEVAPGMVTALTATAVNPGGATPTVTWDACLLPPPPATGQAVNQDCIALPQRDPSLVSFGAGLAVTATMPALSPSMLGLPDQTNGFYLPVRVRLDADGKSLVSFYSLRLGLGALSPNPPNGNPTLTGIFRVPSADAGAAEDAPLDEAAPPEVHGSDEVALRALVTPESQETYVVYDGDPRTTPARTVTEAVRVSWYTTAGHFTNEVTGVDKPDTTLVLDKHLPAAGTPIDLWVVARDDRGGMDVLHRTLLFR